jgi:nitrous oxide reductase accessory protein NosL
MKIYVVESMSYGHCEGVEAVFSSQEKAEAFVKKEERNNPHGNVYPITEMTLDVPIR